MNDLASYRNNIVSLPEVIKHIVEHSTDFIDYREEMIPPTSISYQNAQETTTRYLDFFTTYPDQSPNSYKQYLMEHGITNEKTIHSKLLEYAVVMQGFAKWRQKRTLKEVK